MNLHALPQTHAPTALPPLLCRGAGVPRYYGFLPLTLRPSRADRERAQALAREWGEGAYVPVEDAIALLRRYEEEKMERRPQPVSLYRVLPRERTLRLDLVGSSKSVAEALLFHVALETLREQGVRGMCIRINSVGDRESVGRFIRELASFYRKKMDSLHATCRGAARATHPFLLLQCAHDECRAIRVHAPRPMSFLSDTARIHFKEVLEYLEALRLPYEIHEHLTGPAGISSHTVFEIRDENDALYAAGYRYNHLARRVGARREIPCFSASLFLPPEAFTPLRRYKEASPRVYVIQLGDEARRKSLGVLEALRRADIPVVQSIVNDQLAIQLAHAEALETPFLVIIGHKEALESSALVRDRERSFQDTVPIARLPVHLARLLA